MTTIWPVPPIHQPRYVIRCQYCGQHVHDGLTDNPAMLKHHCPHSGNDTDAWLISLNDNHTILDLA